MLRRVRTLWAALVRRLGGAATPAPLPPPPTPPALTAAAEPPPPTASASASPVAPPPLEPSMVDVAAEPVRAAMSLSASVVAVVAAPAVEPDPARGDALRADAGPALSVRQFFARVAAAVPGGLTVDFRDWQTARVERYFLAMSASGRAPQRGPALAEEVAMKRAFDDFEWD